MDIMKVQGSRSGKALGIGELLASACSASALHWIDHSLVPPGPTEAFEKEEKGPKAAIFIILFIVIILNIEFNKAI